MLFPYHAKQSQNMFVVIVVELWKFRGCTIWEGVEISQVITAVDFDLVTTKSRHGRHSYRGVR